MKDYIVKLYYWFSSIASVFIFMGCPSVFLFVFSIILIPTYLLHAAIGFQIERVENRNGFLIASGTFLILFTLLLPDGLSGHGNNALSELLYHRFGLMNPFPGLTEKIYLLISFVLFIALVLTDISLFSRLKEKNITKKF